MLCTCTKTARVTFGAWGVKLSGGLSLVLLHRAAEWPENIRCGTATLFLLAHGLKAECPGTVCLIFDLATNRTGTSEKRRNGQLQILIQNDRTTRSRTKRPANFRSNSAPSHSAMYAGVSAPARAEVPMIQETR